MPTIYENIRADIVVALKARDAAVALALRTMDAAIQRAAMDLNKPIDDALAVATLRKAVKNLAEAGGRSSSGEGAPIWSRPTTPRSGSWKNTCRRESTPRGWRPSSPPPFRKPERRAERRWAR